MEILNTDQIRNKPATVVFIRVDLQVMSGDYWSVTSHRLLMIDEIMMMSFLHQSNMLKWIFTALQTHDPDCSGSLFILLKRGPYTIGR